MKLTGSIKRKVLYKELHQELLKLDQTTKKEVLFKRIMNTERLFRADFYCPKLHLIVEVNGGQYVQGRHNRGGKGYEDDLIKLNLAQANGYSVLQFTYEMLERGEHIKILAKYCLSVS